MRDVEISRASHQETQVEDLLVAGRYLPAGPNGEAIAGDFYDLFWLNASRVMIAVGDVAGHGPEAFARMTWLRTATRAYALSGDSVADVLERLDRAHGDYDPEDIATLWLGSYDSRSGWLEYASAGHLPPVVVHADGPAVLLAEADAPPLGTGEVGAHLQVHRMRWPPGAALIAYTDGLVERVGCDLEQQLHSLRGVVHRANGRGAAVPPAELVDVVIGELVPDLTAARDDVCVVALRRIDRTPGGQVPG